MTKEETKTTKKTTKSKSTKAPTKKQVTKTTKTPAKRGRKPKQPEITLEEANAVYHVSLLAQAVCVIGILALSIMALYEHSFTISIETLVGVTLLIMAYNNNKIFKRQGLTLVYLVFGTISLVIGILGYFGVTL